MSAPGLTLFRLTATRTCWGFLNGVTPDWASEPSSAKTPHQQLQPRRCQPPWFSNLSVPFAPRCAFPFGAVYHFSNSGLARGTLDCRTSCVADLHNARGGGIRYAEYEWRSLQRDTRKQRHQQGKVVSNIEENVGGWNNRRRFRQGKGGGCTSSCLAASAFCNLQGDDGLVKLCAKRSLEEGSGLFGRSLLHETRTPPPSPPSGRWGIAVSHTHANIRLLGRAGRGALAPITVEFARWCFRFYGEQDSSSLFCNLVINNGAGHPMCEKAASKWEFD